MSAGGSDSPAWVASSGSGEARDRLLEKRVVLVRDPRLNYVGIRCPRRWRNSAEEWHRLVRRVRELDHGVTRAPLVAQRLERSDRKIVRRLGPGQGR